MKMKKSYSLLILILCLVYTQDSYPQSKAGFSLGGGYLYSEVDNSKLPYWKDGYLITFSSDYNIINNFSLFFSSSYQKHFFNEKLISNISP